MTQIMVRYRTKDTHGNRSDIDKAGCSWNDLYTEINVRDSASNFDMLNVEIVIRGSGYHEALNKYGSLMAHFEEHNVILEKVSGPAITQKY